MANRNITLSLPVELIKKAKVRAAERETSINALVKAVLEEALDKDERARRAAREFLEITKRGPYFSEDVSRIRREDLHERR